MNNDAKDFIEHLRTVHFALLAVAFSLLVALLLPPTDTRSRAIQQGRQALAIAKAYDYQSVSSGFRQVLPDFVNNHTSPLPTKDGFLLRATLKNGTIATIRVLAPSGHDSDFREEADYLCTYFTGPDHEARSYPSLLAKSCAALTSTVLPVGILSYSFWEVCTRKSMPHQMMLAGISLATGITIAVATFRAFAPWKLFPADGPRDESRAEPIVSLGASIEADI